MDEKLRQLVDRMPDRPPRSKLEPHADVIRELRKKRRTYQEIAGFLREHVQLSVAPSTIHQFVKTRARQARRAPVETLELPAPPASTPTRASSDTVATRDRLRALRAQPVPVSKPSRFVFDPQEPLTLQPPPPEKK